MKQVIEGTKYPRTKQSIVADLRKMGVERGMTILVHSSLSRIGWVNGGATAVIQALMEAVTEEGTIVMPSQSVELSDPARWGNPPVPESWWKVIRESMPAYDPRYTPVTSALGQIAELFRSFPGVVRSNHPNYSFTAWGKDKNKILEPHSLAFGLGEQSPLGKLYNRESYVLQLGATFDSTTCFHLAEYKINYKKVISQGAPLLVEGERVWKEYQELEFREELFAEIGESYKTEHELKEGHVGSASCRLFSIKEAVDFAEKWLNQFDSIQNAKGRKDGS
ncbi:AAC(3) family N-acetyltransferase [Peribacillus muralis]|uniref:aminoglycoside N(3)-acetyltransferase n=1 Tax=Peribacillus muralis TaxID=264697 RepID=UPI001F4DD905|nr:AAC(3) family N-acetyltransferase [Peribacillus muralis]MCK1992051.1 AAC(3) family N-acetyltransferase [Peribacillus muralis]MCK2012607.1 AAC(3) family N-acetyltransferase [Peribacillus muralis]